MWDVLQYSDAHECISILVWNIKINAILFLKNPRTYFLKKKETIVWNVWYDGEKQKGTV